MAEDVVSDSSSQKDRGFQTASHIPDITRFIPSALAPRAAEHPGVKNYSLFVPKKDDIESYQNLSGRVIELGYDSSRRIDVASTDTPADVRQIPVGTFLRTMEIPDNLGLSAYQVFLIPTGIDALRQECHVFGEMWWDKKGNLKLDVFKNPIPDLPQSRRGKLLAQHSTVQFLIKDRGRLMGNIARQDYVRATETIEMNKFFHTIAGTDPSVEDAYHRFGSFDMRLLFPSLQEINASPATFNQLQAWYPERIAALRDGYVTMGRLFLETVPPYLVTNPEMLISVNDDYGKKRDTLPSLSSLYRIYEFQQAGLGIRLAEAEAPPGYRDTDHPIRTEFAVMVKPLSQTKI